MSRHCVDHEAGAVRLVRRRGYGKSDQLPGGRRSERRCQSAGILCHRIGGNSPSIDHLVGGRPRARVPKLWPQGPTVVARLESRLVKRDESVTVVTCRADGDDAVRRWREMDEPAKRGWHRDPDEVNRWRYWDGKKWTGHAQVSAGGGVSAAIQIDRRRTLVQRVGRTPVVFYPLAWLNCSVPFIRGRLDRIEGPREMRELRKIARNPPQPPSSPGAGVREPRDPGPSAPSTAAFRDPPG